MDAQGTGEVSFSLVLILVNLHKKAGISKLGIKSSYADFQLRNIPQKEGCFPEESNSLVFPGHKILLTFAITTLSPYPICLNRKDKRELFNVNNQIYCIPGKTSTKASS